MSGTRTWEPVVTLKGHKETVFSCAWSPDSRRVATASNDQTLRIWGAKQWKEEARLVAHEPLYCCAWSPDGRWIAAGGTSGWLKFWEAKTCIEIKPEHVVSTYILGCAWSPSSRRIAFATSDQTLRIWDAEARIQVGALKGHKDIIRSCAWSPDEKWIVTASDDKTLIVWDAKRLIRNSTLRGHGGPVTDCAWSPDGKWILSASHDETLKLWPSTLSREKATLKGHKGHVESCAWSPDGRWILSASRDGTIRIWPTKRGADVATLVTGAGGSLSCAWSPGGRWIISASLVDDALRVWDTWPIIKAMFSPYYATRPVRGHLGGVGAGIAAADLYRKAVRLLGEGDIDNGIRILEEATAIAPGDVMIRKRLRAARRKMAALGFDPAQSGEASNASPASQTGSPEIPTSVIDRVHLTVTSPPAVQPGDSFVIYVWAHLERQREEVIERARSLSGGIEVGSKRPLQVSRGTVLSVRLSVEGLIVDQQDTILWDGEIGNANFAVSVPDDARKGVRRGLALIYANELQIARINFVIRVGKVSLDAAPLSTQERRYRKAFASYSSADRDDVLARIQGMLKAAPELEVFVDVVSLRSGQYWGQELFKVIPVNDIFYLFWSKSAMESEWVEKEWRCALSAKGLDFIDPVPLVSPHVVPPPPELAAKHFNDWVLAFMRTEGSKM